jgi:hypothetical protein
MMKQTFPINQPNQLLGAMNRVNDPFVNPINQMNMLMGNTSVNQLKQINQMNTQMNVQNNQLFNPMKNQNINSMNSMIANVSNMNNMMNSPSKNPMNNTINNTMNSPMKNQMNNTMNNTMNFPKNSTMNIPLNNPMTNLMNDPMNNLMNPMNHQMMNFPMNIPMNDKNPLFSPMGYPVNSKTIFNENAHINNMRKDQETLQQIKSLQATPMLNYYGSNGFFQQNINMNMNIHYTPQQKTKIKKNKKDPFLVLKTSYLGKDSLDDESNRINLESVYKLITPDIKRQR